MFSELIEVQGRTLCLMPGGPSSFLLRAVCSPRSDLWFLIYCGLE